MAGVLTGPGRKWIGGVLEGVEDCEAAGTYFLHPPQAKSPVLGGSGGNAAGLGLPRRTARLWLRWIDVSVLLPGSLLEKKNV